MVRALKIRLFDNKSMTFDRSLDAVKPKRPVERRFRFPAAPLRTRSAVTLCDRVTISEMNPN